MKKLSLYSVAIIATVLSVTSAFAQAPELINYQGIARVGTGVLASQNVSLYLIIHDNTLGGSSVYEESQNVTTNAYGLFTVQIGAGTVQSGSFAGINWGVNKKFLEVKIDTAGGTNYIGLGVTQLISVPYALYAKSTDSATVAGSSAFAVYADSAGHAGLASHASYSDSANHAAIAVNAVNALNASYADSSAHSGHSDTALVALNVPLNPWANFALYQEVRPAASSTQTVWTTGAWATVYLNTNSVQLGNTISRNGNVITLSTGTYYIRSVVNVEEYTAGLMTTRLRDATTNTTVLNGNQCYGSASASGGSVNVLTWVASTIEGIVTVTNPTENYQIEGYTNSANDISAYVYSGPGEPAYFTSLFIQKIQ